MKKNSFAILILIISLLSLLVSVSYAWFQAAISINGNTINTGEIIYSAKGYDNLGTTVSQFFASKELQELGSSVPTNANAPLFEEQEMIAGDSNSVYISIAQETGSIDIDYSLSFTVSGDVDNLGIFYYQLINVTDDVVLSSGSSIEDKIASYASLHSSITLTDQRSMTGLSERSDKGSLSTTSAYAVYRLDYGMYSSGTVSSYSGQGISVGLDFIFAQSGSLEDDATYATTYYVGSASELDSTLELVKNGDTIILTSSIEYNKDLVITNPISLVIGSYELSVSGNIRISYSSTKTTTISFTGTGCILAKETNSAGGYFTFNAPNGKLVISGDGGSSLGNIYTKNGSTLNASYDESGVSLEYARFMDLDDDGNKLSTDSTVYVDSNTTVYIANGTVINKIEAVSGSSNIRIIDNGDVSSLVFTNMIKTTQTENPQIDVSYYSTSSLNVSLPTWSAKFVAGTPNTGNTRIRRALNSGNILIVSSQVNFTQADIEYQYTEQFVYDNDPDGNPNTDLTVYYQDRYESGLIVSQSLSEILDNYFLDNPGYSIANVVRLVIISNGKSLTASDIYISGNDTINNLNNLCDSQDDTLSIIDLSQATIDNNALPANAFYQCFSLTELILPNGLVTLGANSINQTSINEITIPSSVTTISQYALQSIRFIHLESSLPQYSWRYLSSYWSTSGQIYPVILVNSAYIDNYRTTISPIANYIFKDGVLDDTGLYVLGSGGTSGGYYINCYASTNIDNPTIGLTGSSGIPIKINGAVVNITGIGSYAYYWYQPTVSTTISFVDSILKLDSYAFGQTSSTNNKDYLTGVNLNKIRTLGDYAFSRCNNLRTVTMNNLVTIGAYAFRYTSIVSAQMPKVETIGERAFEYCSLLTAVYLKNITSISSYAFKCFDSDQVNNIDEFIFDCAPTDITFADYWWGNTRAIQNMRIYAPYSYLSNWNAIRYSDMKAKTYVNFYIHPIGDKVGSYLVNGYDIGQYVVHETETTIIISTINTTINGTYVIPSSNTAYESAYSGSSKLVKLNDFALDMTSIVDANLTFDVDEIGSTTIYVSSYTQKTLSVNTITLTSNVKQLPAESLFPDLEYDTLILEDGVVLNSYSFYNGDMREIDFPNGSIDLPLYVFRYCTNLTTISAANTTVTSCASYVFDGCTLLEAAEFEAFTGGIGTYAFRGSTSLETFSARVVGSIGSNAFDGCTSLSTVDLGSSVGDNITLNSYVFRYCSSLVNTNFDNVTQVESYVFQYCTSLVSMDLEKATYINAHTFDGCIALEEVFLPSLSDGFKGSDPFKDCNSLEYIYFGYDSDMSNVSRTLGIPDTVTNLTIVVNATNMAIKTTDFSALPAGIKIYLGNITSYLAYRQSTSTTYNGLLSHIYECPISDNYTKGVRMEPSVYTNYNGSYYYYTDSSNNVTIVGTSGISLSSSTLTVPSTLGGNSVKRLGFRSFTDLSLSNSEIDLPSSLQTIGASAFESLLGLTSIDLGGTTVIEPYAFYAAADLSSVDSSYVTSIYGYAFAYTTGLISARFTSLEYLYNTSGTNTNNYVFAYSALQSMTLSDNLINVGTNATFQDNSLTAIVLLNYTYLTDGDIFGTYDYFYMASGGKYYEEYCGDLSFYTNATLHGYTLTYYNEIIVSGSYSYIVSDISLSGEDGYQIIGITKNDSSYSTSMTIPSTLYDSYGYGHDVLAVGENAFTNLSSITSLTLPTSLLKITGKAFIPLSNLTYISVSSGGWFGTNSYSFVSYDGVLYSYYYKTLIAYPAAKTTTNFSVYSSNSGWGTSNKCYSIGEYAFYGADNLSMVTVPSSVTAIGQYAFYGCSSSLTVYIQATASPYLGDKAFYISSSQMIYRIYVPNGYFEDYASNFQFNEYYSILQEYYH